MIFLQTWTATKSLKSRTGVMIERLLKAEEAAIASALKAEEDIKAGRIYTADEFKKSSGII